MLLLLAVSFFPQNLKIDTTDFPLKVGNKWFYNYSERKGNLYLLYKTKGRIRIATEINQDGNLLLDVYTYYDSTIKKCKEFWSFQNGQLIINNLEKKELVYNSTILKDTTFYSSNSGWYYCNIYYIGENKKLSGVLFRCQRKLSRITYVEKHIYCNRYWNVFV